MKFLIMPLLVTDSTVAIYHYATIRLNAMSLDNNRYKFYEIIEHMLFKSEHVFGRLNNSQLF